MLTPPLAFSRFLMVGYEIRQLYVHLFVEKSNCFVFFFILIHNLNVYLVFAKLFVKFLQLKYNTME